ncbi:adenosine 3'-phospho 5'-phosphosulfate transporter 2-like [Ruditapes philippinarum]|uniref:adenosine 3'-phospho 5'-phosphosulfate transporter 2-like n=1 Tax=Ruditapes philippinarum TaxID=129788 RepID=UPI00295A613A|nr:adenosine 3'-phospho 5'-phosphosulfate transporter 2-like [Ruditapes philippinarum]XP_060583197.1 adenosine 3'-phospho 5'-phosphosulfate transporter 2-like [Ruditapes philippinarum]
MSRDSKKLRTESHLRQILGLRDITYIEMGDNLETVDKKKEMKIFFVDLTYFSSTAQFLILCSATFFFYLIYGYFQELIFRLEEFRPHGWYLTLVQFFCYTCFGLIEMVATGDRSRKIPLKMYCLLAFLTVATMGLSNTSVGYLNYPTQVIFKCCKLIPVMIGGVLIQGKKYSPLDVTAMLMMVVGLILFTLADNSVSPSFNTYGVILITLALCADGLIGNFQEKTLKQYSAGNSEMVFYSYSLGLLYIFIGILLLGDFVSAFKVCQEYPMQTYGYGLIFSLSGYIGLYIVLTLVKSFGALIAVTVTTCRKAVTIILSFLFFTKPFTYQYVWSGLIVVLGIYLNVYSKNKASWDITLTQWYWCIRQKLGLQRNYPITSITSTIV